MRNRARLGFVVASTTLFACALIGGLGTLDTLPGALGEGGMDAAIPMEAAIPTDVVRDSPSPSTCPSPMTTCVPAAPPGFSGPVELYEGPQTPPCGSGYPTPFFDGGRNLNAPPASCACTCDVADASCSPVQITLWSESTCQGNPLTSATLDGACQSVVTGTITPYSVFVNAPSSGVCAPVPMATIPPATWGSPAVACQTSTPPVVSGCEAGTVCAPVRDPGFASLCVYQSGQVACPASYPHPHVDYAAIMDGRSCTPCGCGDLPSCTPIVSEGSNGCFFGNTFGSGCSNTTFDTTDQWSATAVARTTCAVLVGGGEPAGDAASTQPFTFCCQ